MQTSFDTPRLASTNPLAASGNLGYSIYDEPTGSSDPWSSPPSTSTSIDNVYAAASSGSSGAAPVTLLDESRLPSVYAQAWRAVVAGSSAAANGSAVGPGGSSLAIGSTSFANLHKVLSLAAGLSASEVEKVNTQSMITSRHTFAWLRRVDLLRCLLIGRLQTAKDHESHI